jgi:dihydropteroate synthase
VKASPRQLALPRGRSLRLDKGPLVMGIINLTPDSFYAPSRRRGAAAALEAALAMEAEGASIVDLGGESTRPGADYVGEEEELERLVPAVAAIRSRSSLPISVDTRKAAVARAALEAGADVINDVSALRHDPDMAALAAGAGAAVILMHMQGEPRTMQEAPAYADCAVEVRDFLAERAAASIAAGISPSSILLDPGIGFGKRLEDNLDILARLDLLTALGYPVVIGLSRKALIGSLSGRAVGDRLGGSLGAACAAFAAGAALLRVHDVAQTVDALRVFASIRPAGRCAASEGSS